MAKTIKKLIHKQLILLPSSLLKETRDLLENKDQTQSQLSKEEKLSCDKTKKSTIDGSGSRKYK